MEFRNQEQIELENKFQKKVDIIESKYLPFFEKNKPVLSFEQNDKLKYHFDFFVDYKTNFYQMTWNENSNLSQDLKDEVETAFKETFV